MVKVAPSILAANFENLEEEIKSVVDAGADIVHVDVMDGEFVPNETPGIEMYERAKKLGNTVIDTHLMVENPENWLEDFIKSDIISFHIEAVDEETCDRLIERIHEYDIKVGIAIKPNTSVDEIKPFLDKIDMVLVMTVEPGFGGQKMIEQCLDKIKVIKDLNPYIEVEVDGGINIDNAEMVKNAGATILVAGTAIFKASDRKSVIEKLKK